MRKLEAPVNVGSMEVLGMGAMTGSVMFALKSEPGKVTALDFLALHIGDDRMTVYFGGGEKTCGLHDVAGITVRLNATRQEQSSSGCKGEEVSR